MTKAGKSGAVRFGSLFAGIGGFDLGLERAGMTCAWQVDNDAKCQQVLGHHWPDVPRYGDVRDVGKRNLEPVDVIVGGFPCQDLSVAGRRAGLAGERSGLWWEFHRVIAELNPPWVVIENVPGLLSSNGGRDMGTLLRSLGELRYWWAYRCLDAQYDGLAQRRKRVFIVGYSGDVGRLVGAAPGQDASRLAGLPAQVLFESESLPGHPPPGRETGEKVAGPITKSFAKHSGCSAGKDSYPRNVVIAFPGMAQAGAGWAPPSMPIDEDKSGPLDTKRAQCVAYQCHGSNVGPLGTLRKGEGTVQSGVPFIARPLAHGQTVDHYDESQQTYVVAGTLQANMRRQGGETYEINGYLQPSMSGVRRLTPTECERLQGFPDGWTAVNGMSDTARYRMLGNAVAVPVAEWIGRRIVAVAKGGI